MENDFQETKAGSSTNSGMTQINYGNSRGYQTTVNGGTAYFAEYIKIVEAERKPPDPKTQQEYRQKKVLLSKVKEYWIEGVLEKSLHSKAMIELGLEKRLDAVERPFKFEELPEESRQKLSTGTGVTDVFNQMEEGRTLLILGEPGAGKTITLLKLAQNLITRAEEDLSRLIPVVFNLSSWGSKRQTIANWLVEELNSKYQVSKKLGKTWIEDQQLLLLLDGLDEVKAEHREACVQAINQFMQEHGQTEVMVCSRIRDYEALSIRLQLRGAIYICSLTSEQVHRYLDTTGELETVKRLLQEDTELQELAKSPLTLSIMTLAYQGKTVEELSWTGSLEERRQHLFNAYIERMLRRKGEHQYSNAQVKRWLSWLAQRMSQESQTVFLIERMQPTWLDNQAQRIVYRIGSGLFAVITMILVLTLAGKMDLSRIGMLISFGMGVSKGEIKTVEKLKWSWRQAISSFIGMFKVGLIVGLIIAGLIMLVLQKFDPFAWLISAVFIGVFIGLIFLPVYGFVNSEIETKTVPNQGILISARRFVIFQIVGGLIGGLIGSNQGLNGLFVGVGFGLFGALSLGAFFGGSASIQHFTLRLILNHKGLIPWNYAHFLEYAVDRIFLQKVGGGYIFMHRMLLEHFAQMKP